MCLNASGLRAFVLFVYLYYTNALVLNDRIIGYLTNGRPSLKVFFPKCINFFFNNINELQLQFTSDKTKREWTMTAFSKDYEYLYCASTTGDIAVVLLKNRVIQQFVCAINNISSEKLLPYLFLPVCQRACADFYSFLSSENYT